MSVERIVLIAMWIVGPTAALLLVPRRQHRRFAMGYLICQTLNWLVVAIHVQLDAFVFPIREFPKATDMSLTLQYMFFPAFCGIYLIRRPERPWPKRLAWFLSACTALALYFQALARYTDLVEFHRYNFALNWAGFALTLTAIEAVYLWLFRGAVTDAA